MPGISGKWTNIGVAAIIVGIIALTVILIGRGVMSGHVPEGLVVDFNFTNGKLTDDQGELVCKARGVLLAEDRFGNPGGAYFFTGNRDSYINLGTSPRLKMPVASISLWVKVQETVFKGEGMAQNPILFTRAHEVEYCNEAYFIGFNIESRCLNVNTSLSKENQTTLYPPNATKQQEWHHVVLTYNDAELCFYLDGILINKGAKNFRSQFLATDSVILGNRVSHTNNRFFNGCIDDVMYFNRVLSPKEVRELYEVPNPNRIKDIIEWINIALGACVLIALLMWFVRKRIARAVAEEREKNTLLNAWYEQESRVLSAQMDPHFIFNSLNTIQQFVVTGDNDKAQDYLSKFSKLLRKMLESSSHGVILLADELELCRRYLEIEAMRFNKAFSYEILVDPEIKVHNLMIPHFLIQPLLENAIWHGLLPKEGDRHIKVQVKMTGTEILAWTVDDNGVGRKMKKPAQNEKPRSLAVGLIQQRLELMGKLKGQQFSLKIIDKTGSDGESQGTCVIITMPATEKEKSHA